MSGWAYDDVLGHVREREERRGKREDLKEKSIHTEVLHTDTFTPLTETVPFPVPFPCSFSRPFPFPVSFPRAAQVVRTTRGAAVRATENHGRVGHVLRNRHFPHRRPKRPPPAPPRRPQTNHGRRRRWRRWWPRRPSAKFDPRRSTSEHRWGWEWWRGGGSSAAAAAVGGGNASGGTFLCSGT